MPVCPKCHARYGPGTAWCAGCDVPLLNVVKDGSPVPERDPEPPLDDQQLVLLLEEPLPEIAGMIGEFLENSGIDCVVQSESIGLLYRLPAPGAPISRARVYVRGTDFLEARELVTHFFNRC